MTWNYRIIKHDFKKPAYFAVHEVYYNDIGKITNWTVGAIDLTAESRKDILETLKQIATDSKMPILNESELIKLTKNRSKIKLILTCSACPEQYDAFLGSKQVGYLRLRGGWFRVDYPDVGGKTIYEARPSGDGAFSDDERDHYLNEATMAIEKELAHAGKSKTAKTASP